MKFGIEHILILSKDVKALVDWYVNLFDWEIVIDGGPDVYMVKASNGNMIEFGRTDVEGGKDAANAVGFRHLAICVDDFDAAVEKVRAAGVNGLKDPVVADNGLGIMFFEDPDGNLVHLVSRPVAL